MLAISFRKVLNSCLFKTGREPLAQLVQFRFLAFEEAKARPQGFAHILVSAGSDQPVDKFRLGIGENDVSRGHVATPLHRTMAIYANNSESSNWECNARTGLPLHAVRGSRQPSAVLGYALRSMAPEHPTGLTVFV